MGVGIHPVFSLCVFRAMPETNGAQAYFDPGQLAGLFDWIAIRKTTDGAGGGRGGFGGSAHLAGPIALNAQNVPVDGDTQRLRQRAVIEKSLLVAVPPGPDKK